MTFSEKLKKLRAENKLSQSELAKKAGISTRTLQNYELGKRYPSNVEITSKLASALGVGIEYLVTDGEMAIISSPRDAKKELRKLVESVAGLFAGGEVGEEDRDAALEAIIAAYWAAKKENRKYSSDKKGNLKK